MTQFRRMLNFSRVARLIFIAALPTIFATCDLVQPPDADGPVEISFSSPFTLVAGRNFAPPVVVTQSGVIVSEPRIQVTSSDPAIVSVSASGVLQPLERGRVTIKARLLGSTLGSTPPEATLDVQVIAHRVEAQLSALTMRSLSDTLTLVAKALAEDGRVLHGQNLGWTSSAPAVVSVDTLTGKLTTHTNGTALIVAEVDGRKDTVNLAVSQRLFNFTFQPASVVFNSIGDTLTITATPRDSGGTPMAQSFLYESSAPSGVSVGLAGRLTALANGPGGTPYFVRAVSGTVVDSVRVEVRQVAQRVVITGPDTVAIEAINDTLQLVALPFDARNGSVLNNKPTWQSRSLGVAVVDNVQGIVRGLAVGSTWIIAALENGIDSVNVIVSNDAERLVVTPDSVFITALQDVAQLTGVPQNRLGVPLSNLPVAWSALDPAVASVNAQGAVTGNAIGTTRVIGTAVLGTLADTATIVVVNLPDFIDILPTTKTLASIGDTLFPAVDFRNSRGAALSRGAVTWFSKDPVVASVSSNGVGQAVGPGTTYIVAFNPANQARRDSIEVIVTNAPVSLTLNRPPVGKTADTLTSPSKTLQYSADVRNGAGTLIPNVTINWRSTNTAIADVSPSGLVTAGGLGTVSIIAEVTGALGLKADTAVLVALNVPATLTVNPTAASISAVGGTQQLTATARNDLGNIISGLTFGFGTSNGAVAAVSGTGMVTAQGPGTATITATIPTLTGTLSATADISVVNPPDLVDIIPTTLTLGSVNDSATPAVDFRTVLGSPLPRTAATWSSDDPSVAQVTSGGIVIAQARGVTKVRAINPINASRRDSIDVTVTNATVIVDLNRTDDTLTAPGRTLPYTATPLNARGNVVANELITWVSRTPSVASVSAQGLATALTTGLTRIVALVGTVGDSAPLLVTNKAVSVELTPSPVFINTVGGTQQLTATARNDLGGIITSPVIAWGTGNGAIATVNGTGLITGAGIGSTTATATVDGVTAVVTINVANDIVLVNILTPDTTLVSAGDTVTLGYDFRNSSNALLPRDVADWRSSDPNILTVSGTGVVIAKARGVARVKAVSPDNVGVADSITITVADTPDSVALSRADTTLTSFGRTLAYSATAFNANGLEIASQAITFVSRNTAVATIDPIGLATAVGLGTTRIVALAGLVGDSSNLTVTNNAVSVEMTPARDTILDLGGTLQLVAIARNDLGGVVPGAVLTFTTLQPSIATVSASGLVTASAVNTGIDSIVVQAPGGLRDTTVILVANAPRTVAITSGPVTLASIADQLTLAANIRNLASVVLPRTSVTWTSSVPTVVAVNDVGVVTAMARGVATITATSPHDPTLNSSVTVTVTNAPVSVVLNASTVHLSALGRTFGMIAVVRNAAGNPVTDTSVTWSAGAASVDITASGIVTAVSVDTTFVTATVTGTAVSNTAVIEVTNLPVSVTAGLTAVTLSSLQDTLYLKATAHNDLGGAILGVPARWTSSNTAVVGVGPGAGTAAAFTQTDSVRIRAIGVGQATVRARIATGVASDSVDVTMTVTVRNDPTVVDLTGPTAVTLANLGRTDTPAADIRDALTAVLSRSAVLWTTTNPSVVTVTNLGVVTGVGAGTAKVSATSPSNALVTDTVTYTVEAPAYSITLNASTDSLVALGQTRAYTATVRDSLGNVLPSVGGSIAWTAANNAGPKVTFAPTTGYSTTATAAAVTGATRATLTATVTPTTTLAGASLAASVNVGVGNEPVSIVLNPASVAIGAVAGIQVVTATVLNAVGLPIAGSSLTWSASAADSAKVTLPVSPTAGSGTLTAAAVGSVTVTVTVTGTSVSTTLPVAIGNNPAVVTITPAAVTLLNLMRTSTPAVDFQNALGASLARTAVLWTTTNASVATVTSGGVITGVGAGTAKIAATSPADPALTDSMDVTVQAPAYGITLDQSVDSLTALTQSRVYTATVRDSLGNVLPGVGGSVAWSDANNAGPSVTFTPTTGFTTTATAAAVTGATRVTLTATVTPVTVLAGASLAASVNVGVGNDAASVAASPAGATITSVGGTASITPTVRNGLGGVIAGAQVTWATSNAGVVTVPVGATTGAQNITAAGVGTAVVTITAASGVQTTVFVTVAKVASAATSTITALPTSINANGVATSTITVQLKDAGGTNLSNGGDAVTLAIQAPALGTSLGTVSDHNNGTYTATLTAGTTLGQVTITGTVNTVTIVDDATVDLVAGPATVLVVTGLGSQQAGDAQTVSITAQDAQGHTAASYTGVKTLTFGGALASPSGQAPTATNNLAADIDFGNPTAVTFTAGVASSSVKLYLVQTALVAVDDGLIAAAGGNRLSVNVTADGLDNFAFSLSSPQTNGLAFTGTNTLTARDLYHNPVTTFDASADAVTVSANGPLAGVVTGLGSGNNAILDQAGDFVSGVANLTAAMAYTGAAQTGTFTATAASSSAGTSNAVTIAAGAATQLAISGGGTHTAGDQQVITITARDQSGNTATTYAGDEVLVFSGANQAITGQNPTVEDKNDVEQNFGDPATITFTGGVASRQMRLFLTETALINVDDGTLNATGNELNVAVGAAGLDNLVFSLTSPQVINETFTGANTLTARDAFNNIATAFNASLDNVTITGDAPLNGGIAVEGLGSGGLNVLDQAGDFTGGVADLSALGMRYRGVIGTGTFTATSSTAKTGQSGLVVVTPGEALQMQITGTPTQAAGAAQTIQVRAFDAGGNTATGYAGDKILTFSGAGAAPNGQSPTVEDKNNNPVNFGDPTTITFVGGIATRDMRLFQASAALVSATDGTIDAVSNELSVTVSPDVLDNFSLVLADPQQDGLAFTSANTLTARDQFNNTVTTFAADGDNVTFTTGPAGGVVSGLSGGDVLNSAGDFTAGVADLTALGITYTGPPTGSITFTATSASAKTGAATITVNP